MKVASGFIFAIAFIAKGITEGKSIRDVVTCEPFDQLVDSPVYQNQRPLEVELNYFLSVGTVFEEGTTELEQDELFERFGSVMGNSNVTDFDWNALNLEEKGDFHLRTKAFIVPPMTKYVISQVQGRCDGTIIYTESAFLKEIRQ